MPPALAPTLASMKTTQPRGRGAGWQYLANAERASRLLASVSAERKDAAPARAAPKKEAKHLTEKQREALRVMSAPRSAKRGQAHSLDGNKLDDLLRRAVEGGLADAQLARRIRMQLRQGSPDARDRVREWSTKLDGVELDSCLLTQAMAGAQTPPLAGGSVESSVQGGSKTPSERAGPAPTRPPAPP